MFTRIETVREELYTAVEDLKQLAITKAQAERAYRIALRQQLLFLRSQGHGINLCLELAKGDDKVTDLKLNFDIAESNYYIGLEKIKALRQDMEVMRTMLTTERLLTKED